MNVMQAQYRRASASGTPRWLGFASPIAFFILWEILSRTNIVDSRIVAPPTKIFATLVGMIAHDNFLVQIGITLLRFTLGLLLGALPGTFIGLTMGLFRWPRALLQPLISMFYPLPHIALFPIVLILVGQNERSNQIMIALGPFFTMIIVATSAVRSIEPIYLDVARSFETSMRDLYMRIVFPAVLPALAAGFRVSLGMALVGTIAVEFLVADSGIGHVIWNSWQVLSLSQSVAGLAVAGAIGFIIFGAFAVLERRLIRWKPQ